MDDAAPLIRPAGAFESLVFVCLFQRGSCAVRRLPEKAFQSLPAVEGAFLAGTGSTHSGVTASTARTSLAMIEAIVKSLQLQAVCVTRFYGAKIGKIKQTRNFNYLKMVDRNSIIERDDQEKGENAGRRSAKSDRKGLNFEAKLLS